MTREERLELLKQIEKDIYVPSIESTFLDEAKSCAIHSAIEELEQEPTTKNDLVTLAFSKGTLKYSCKDYVVYKKEWLRNHYGAEINIMFGDSQYKEPTTKNDLGVDCISRAYAIQAMQDKAKKLTNEDTINGLCGAVAILFDLPSVTPQPRKGHWIYKEYDEETGMKGVHFCSECGYPLTSPYISFCSVCGADMRGEE